MLSRHDLVWLTDEGWRDARATIDAANLDVIARWQERQWPAIVRRNDQDVAAGQICLGIAAAPDSLTRNKRRVALRTRLDHIAKTRSALPLRDVLAAAPPAWQAALSALRDEAGSLNVRVYGSLALQAVTGDSYVTPQSDIDLLLVPRCVDELEAGLALFADYCGPLPLDGEIVFPTGEGVAWKEWINAEQGKARVLVKGRDGVRLDSIGNMLATLNGGPA
jgi:phosphoribosyl-dephospho-CoA transferase